MHRLVGSSLLERDERQKPRPWLGALPFRSRKSQSPSDVDLADARQGRGQSCGAEPRDAYFLNERGGPCHGALAGPGERAGSR